MTIEQLDASIEAIVAAMGNGELTVRFSDGRQVTYQSAADLAARLRALRTERDAVLLGVSAPTVRMRSFPVVFRR